MPPEPLRALRRGRPSAAHLRTLLVRGETGAHPRPVVRGHGARLPPLTDREVTPEMVEEFRRLMIEEGLMEE